MENLDSHQKPPEEFRQYFKRLQRATVTELRNEPSIVDAYSTEGRMASGFQKMASIDASGVSFALPISTPRLVGVFESPLLPGLSVYIFLLPSNPSSSGFQFIPGLLTPDAQLDLISMLLHRDLADPLHLTNVHKHYRIPYEVLRLPELPGLPNCESRTSDALGYMAGISSFFNVSPNASTLLQPFDPTTHKPLTFSQFLGKKLRWITLGGQYDWTRKEYPNDKPPAFPEDVGSLVQAAFPRLNPEAAIVNVYSPGDILSLHRDVSEESSQGLASISLGCEAVFVVGLQDAVDSRCVAIRLRSGDAVYMSGSSRYAWHGVPRIIADSCPSYLRAWPAAADQHGTNATGPTRFEVWRNWLATKRINLNVRQMFDSEQG